MDRAWWLSIIFAVLLLVPIALGQPRASENTAPTVAKIFYSPFEANPTFGITERTIESDSLFQIEIIGKHPRYYYLGGDHPLLTKLKHILMKTAGVKPLEEGQLRLKLKLSDDTFFVDANGRVLRASTKERFQLSEQQMKDIGRDIEYLAGVIDIRSIQYTDAVEAN